MPMQHPLLMTFAAALVIWPAASLVHGRASGCFSDESLYFWHVVAESHLGRSIYYRPKDREPSARVMGLEAALQSCIREDCVVGISADSDADAIDMLEFACKRRVQPDVYRRVQVRLFGRFAEVGVSDLFAGCTMVSTVAPAEVDRFVGQQSAAIEDVRCER